MSTAIAERESPMAAVCAVLEAAVAVGVRPCSW
jgi:hypothetical protein